MFINFSNHKSAQWDVNQKAEAEKYGSIIDRPFPNVPSGADTDKIVELAEKEAAAILGMLDESGANLVMCQGEFGLAFAVTRMLQARKVDVCGACSDRVVNEKVMDDGATQKVVTFKFVKFRKYPVL